jgi:hypothetical protein
MNGSHVNTWKRGRTPPHQTASQEKSEVWNSRSFPLTFMRFLAFPILFFVGGTKVSTQGFMSAQQALYHLSHSSSPYGFVSFGDGVFWTICNDWPTISIFPTSRITDVSHQCLTCQGFRNTFKSTKWDKGKWHP